jgi:hypothetical protein
MVKSMGFQLRWQRKHRAKLVRGLTAVLDSLHSGQGKINCSVDDLLLGQFSRRNSSGKGTSLRNRRNWSRRM